MRSAPAPTDCDAQTFLNYVRLMEAELLLTPKVTPTGGILWSLSISAVSPDPHELTCHGSTPLEVFQKMAQELQNRLHDLLARR